MIPFLDLKAQYASIRAEILAAITAVLDSGQYSLGPAVAEFEHAFARFCGVEHVVAVSSGTSALHLALLAAGVRKGDEVITTAHTFIATAAAVEYIGARPVLVDIELERMTIDPAKVEAAITLRTRAIIPVHLYGQCADMGPILAIAQQRGIAVVADAAQAHGASYQGKPVATLGGTACFSFYPGKNLGAYGEGGAIATNETEWANAMRAMRDWGQRKKGEHTLPGFNYRMDNIQGAVLGVKLARLNEWNARRRSRAALYDKLIRERIAHGAVIRPQAVSDGDPVWHLYVVRVRDRDGARARMERDGVQTGIHYPLPVHLQPVFAHLGYHAGDFPVAEAVTREIISLPIYPELTDRQVVEVVDSLGRAVTGV